MITEGGRLHQNMIENKGSEIDLENSVIFDINAERLPVVSMTDIARGEAALYSF